MIEEDEKNERINERDGIENWELDEEERCD